MISLSTFFNSTIDMRKNDMYTQNINKKTTKRKTCAYFLGCTVLPQIRQQRTWRREKLLQDRKTCPSSNLIAQYSGTDSGTLEQELAFAVFLYDYNWAICQRLSFFESKATFFSYVCSVSIFYHKIVRQDICCRDTDKWVLYLDGLMERQDKTEPSCFVGSELNGNYI